MRMKTIAAAALAGTLIVLATAAGAHVLPTGGVTSTEANSTWTAAHLAGAVTEDGHVDGYGPDFPAYPVDWHAVVTVAPSLPAYACQGDEARDSDPNITAVAYFGPTQTTSGTVTFDLPAASILSGVYGQRACLSTVATVRRQNPLSSSRPRSSARTHTPHARPKTSSGRTRSRARRCPRRR